RRRGRDHLPKAGRSCRGPRRQAAGADRRVSQDHRRLHRRGQRHDRRRDRSPRNSGDDLPRTGDGGRQADRSTVEAPWSRAGVSTRALTAVLPLALLVGCGSSNHSISNVKVTAAPSTGGASTFSAPGMAIHFRFPSRFHPISLAPSKGVAGNTGQATHAAVALTKYDLLRVTRFPNRSVAVTPKNISSVRSTYDRTLSGAFGV